MLHGIPVAAFMVLLLAESALGQDKQLKQSELAANSSGAECEQATAEKAERGYSGDYILQGKHNINAFCSRCHGRDGRGAKGPDLTSGRLRHAKTEQEIIDVIANGIPGTGMIPFGAGYDEYYRPVAAYILSHQPRESDAPMGDAIRGASLYKKHNCGSCHWTGSSGGKLGTNLARLTATPEYVRESMRYPDSQVDGTHQRVTLLNRAGRILAGKRLSEDTYDILVMDLQENLYSVAKSDLEHIALQPESLMPSYHKLLSDQDIEDITTYLFSIQKDDVK